VRRVSALVVAVALTAGCSGDHERDVLESVLSTGGISFCGYGCRDFETAGADCSRAGVRFGGREYYNCTVSYRGTDYISRICAALAPETEHGYIARDECRPGGG
jgi:hypothetical protein